MPPALVLLLSSLTQAAPAVTGALAPSRAETAGLALAVEVGRHAQGYGLELLYLQPLPPVGHQPVTLSAEVGVGITKPVPRAVVGGGGIGVSLGRRHRGLLALGWETHGRSILSLHGTTVADRWLHGPEVDAGYELVSDTGPMVRVLVGATYLPRSWQESFPQWEPKLRLGFGWKFR
jgi:hypothetical protein